MIAWVDGDWVDEADGRVPINDRGYLYGDGVFDTCRLFEGGWLWFDDHARRLHGSADILGLPRPSVDRLRQLAEDLLARNPPVDHGVLRMTLTGAGEEATPAGDGPRSGGDPSTSGDADRPGGRGYRLVMTLRPLRGDWRERAARGWRCITADVRHPPPAVLPPALKGQGRLFSLLARREAERAGCDQALLLSVDGRITEGATWNVFWRSGTVIRTPSAATGVLEGVTRSRVMELVPAAGYTLETGTWARSELNGADEVFATMTSLGVVPIVELDGRSLPERRPAAESLATLLWERAREVSVG